MPEVYHRLCAVWIVGWRKVAGATVLIYVRLGVGYKYGVSIHMYTVERVVVVVVLPGGCRGWILPSE